MRACVRAFVWCVGCTQRQQRQGTRAQPWASRGYACAPGLEGGHACAPGLEGGHTCAPGLGARAPHAGPPPHTHVREEREQRGHLLQHEVSTEGVVQLPPLRRGRLGQLPALLPHQLRVLLARRAHAWRLQPADAKAAEAEAAEAAWPLGRARQDVLNDERGAGAASATRAVAAAQLVAGGGGEVEHGGQGGAGSPPRRRACLQVHAAWVLGLGGQALRK